MRRIGVSIRVACVAMVVCAVSSVVILSTGGATAPTYGSAVASGSLVGNPLVVPGVESIVGGQMLASEVAARANPQAAAARERSRTAYGHLSSRKVRQLLGEAFPDVIKHSSAGVQDLPAGARILGYPSANAIRVALPGHQMGIVESSWPVAKQSSHGHFAPIDLTLTASGTGYVPARSNVAVQIPRELSVGVKTPENGVSLTPVDPQGRPLSGQAELSSSSIVYANTERATDTVVKPTPTGFQLDAALRSTDSPQQFQFEVSVPSGSVLAQDPNSGVVRVRLNGSTLATILPPGAKDAAGTAVPTSMSVTGNKITVNVGHRTGSYLYPIAVDPEVNDSQLATTTGGKRANWEFKSSNEARFGHKSIYEGPGKEHLETTGIAEYSAAEFAYWAYETKGNSKIYELKSKTSAKNKLAKIESILQFSSPAGNENWQMLSNEFSEPEYSEKVSTICAWNASKVEECLPGAGKEKNAVRFQQSATASPGSNFKFSDTMNEGVVSISEPAGEHSTTKFNTTSPEVEGEVEVEGKKIMQKRANALYGAGIWLTKFKGALQLIGKDPGIGVSATRLEYEKSAGVWEQLSSHNYLENENGCQGVQCYVEPKEYWTVDPKLPDGEDKIRYRAEEAIAGTVSLTTEPESTKTVKVDTKAPHNIFLNGLPYGNELSEKPYTLSAEATDGEGSTVASSGIKSLALFVSGHEIAELGTQTGCSVAKGGCAAKAEWSINGAELGAGHHAIVIVATDKAGNESSLETTISIRHSTPVRLGPGSVDLQSGDYSLGVTDVSMGSGLTVSRNYSSRSLERGVEGALGPQWSMSLGNSESLVELVDGGVMLTSSNGGQSIFAGLGEGKFEAPNGDSNLTLELEENKTTKQKLAYYLKNKAAGTSVKFTMPSGTKIWLPTKQEGTVATDTVTYSYQTVEHHTQFKLAAGMSRAETITTGPDGNLWFGTNVPTTVAMMTTSGAILKQYEVAQVPLDIVTGPDGRLWWVSEERIGNITTLGAKKEYSLPVGSHANSIAVGPDGNLWFSEGGTSKIGKITTAGARTEYSLPVGSEPNGVTTGPDGNLWFVTRATSKVEKMTTSGTIAGEYALPAESHLWDIVAGADGNMWLTAAKGKVAKVTTSGAITEYSVPAGSEPSAIAAGSDKNIWFAEKEKIGKITSSGAITEYSTGTGSEPWGITNGPDGNVWYNARGAKAIGMMTTSGTITEPTEVLAPVPAGVSCSPEMKAGCRALKFSYNSTNQLLKKISLNAYDPVSKKMQETTVAEYTYDAKGWLKYESDPRLSLITPMAYGYDVKGRLTAFTSAGTLSETWAFTYGTIPGDAGTGRLLKATQAPASAVPSISELMSNSEAPVITGSVTAGVKLAVSNGKWGSRVPVAYGYQWEDCNSFGEECQAIPGAVNANYTVSAGDIGHTLVAEVTATDGSGSASAVTTATSEVEPGTTEYALPSGSHPFGIATGWSGSGGDVMWFTDSGTGKVGWISEGEIKEFATENHEPEGIMRDGASKNAWFVEHGYRHVSNMTSTGSLTQYSLGHTNSSNVGISLGSDGNSWVTESGADYIAKMNKTGTVLAEYALPAGSKPYGITLDPANVNLWFTNYGTSKIGKITTAGVITEYALPAGSKPYGIASGPDGNLWFTNYGTNKIGKITTAGVITEYALPAGSQPVGIVSPAVIGFPEDGDMWFTNSGTSKLGRITTAGAITEYALPSGSQPMGIAVGLEDGFLWFTDYATNKLTSFNPKRAEGGSVTPGMGYTLEYGVPLSGSGLPSMTSADVAKWGQKDDPVEATAILPPDAHQGWPASSYIRASIYYLDSQGRTVNTSSPSNASYGSVTTTEYNELNEPIRVLTADNRQIALEAGSKSEEVSKVLDTQSTYNGEGFKEGEVAEPGTQLIDVLGPQHQVKYMAGSEQKESLARLHTKYFYNEGAPSGTYDLVTKATTLAQLANEEEVEVRKTTTSYSGQSNLGWKLRAPTSVTVDPEGKKLTTTTLYNATTGQITETRQPAGSGGGSAHDTKFIYYSSGENTEGYPGCGGHPEWVGLMCETLPAKQPETGGLPKLPVTTVTYNVWNEPLTTTETFGSTVRTKTTTYDVAGRIKSDETTSTADVALPTVSNEYSIQNGLLANQRIVVEGKTKSVISKYNRLGQLTEYTDADGGITKYRYGGPENDNLLEEVADGSNGGTGKQTYTYNATTKLMEELTDSSAGTFSASYDAEGNLVSEVYPNAMCADYKRNSVGEATQIEYIKTTNCAEHSAPVWFSETRSPSVRGESLSRSSTLASETYKYDTVGRLTETQETPVGEGCSVRLYAYDEESNRTSQTTRAPGGGGACATEGGTVLNHTYDEGNRLTDSGIAYDSFGNVTKLPAADAEGHELSSTFYVDNAVATQSQNGVTNNYYLDPKGRVRETVSGANAIVTHYDGSGGAVAWTSETGGKSTRNIPGIDGTLSATQTNGATPVLQLHDLQGDVVATAALASGETKVLSTYNSTEFGVPNKGAAPPKYAWLGASDVASAFTSGVITYGSTSYVPQTGRALQSEAVEPPGAPQGSGAGAPYTSPNEPWVFQGAAAAGAEAPGREAARELAALEAATIAIDPIVFMNRTKAKAKGEALLKAALWAEIALLLDIPESVVELVGSKFGESLGLNDAFEWLHDAGEKLIKCAENKRWRGPYKVNICRFQYSELENTILKAKFVDFSTEPDVEECVQPPGEIMECPWTVYIYKVLEA